MRSEGFPFISRGCGVGGVFTGGSFAARSRVRAFAIVRLAKRPASLGRVFASAFLWMDDSDMLFEKMMHFTALVSVL